jgi:hypothetical protein
MNSMSNSFAADIARIEDQVRSRLSGRVRCLCIRLEDNGLVLRGRTASYYAKQIAQHALMEACSLPIRANEIEVS